MTGGATMSWYTDGSVTSSGFEICGDLMEPIPAALELAARVAAVPTDVVPVLAALTRLEPTISAALNDAAWVTAIPRVEITIVTLLPILKAPVSAALKETLTVTVIPSGVVSIVALLPCLEEAVPAAIDDAARIAFVVVEDTSVITFLATIDHPIPAAGARAATRVKVLGIIGIGRADATLALCVLIARQPSALASIASPVFILISLVGIKDIRTVVFTV